jgi:hypothetical protein
VDAGKIQLHDPSIVGAIHVGRRVPKSTGWSDTPLCREEREITFRISHINRISEKGQW